ncbi:YceH family protein [Xylophilus ampelinus]|uniref:Uncharacterized protein n=1 Tax=Xylophilus ampelinus TaxID=54067 RepID=A0A318SCS7_9BURK|nr:YceH family protein [Xylophilus ampelinus]MCS4511485.1 YceH family protein [Xylophilus ampelinus]PYE74817.1 hypothetical protein DFQ15_12418 [Xylophilus ampelinus]
MAIRPLSPLEQRVLGTLMEKARTVPDSYPLTLNAVVSGCNQKSSREPAMQVTDGEAQEALDELKRLSLVFETSGGRATRYEHNVERAYAVPGAAAALLGLLILRGPQTAGELRIHGERWHRFADIGSVEAFLDELSERSEEKGGPLVLRLPRAPGAREARWVQLVGGPVDVQSYAQAGPADGAAPATGLAARVEALEAAVAALKAELAGLRGDRAPA